MTYGVCRRGLSAVVCLIAVITAGLLRGAAPASEADPEISRYHKMAKELIGKGLYDDAVKLLSVGINRHPGAVGLYDLRGTVVGDYLDRPIDAVSDYTSIIKYYPDSYKAYYKRGHYLSMAGEQQLAIRDFGRSLEISPKYGKAYMGRAESYEKLGMKAEAIGDLRACLTHSPEYAPAAQRMLKRLLGEQ